MFLNIIKLWSMIYETQLNSLSPGKCHWNSFHLPNLSHSPLNDTSLLNIFIYRSYIFTRICHFFFLFPSKGTWKIVLEISVGLLVCANTKLIIINGAYDLVSRQLATRRFLLFLNIWGSFKPCLSLGSSKNLDRQQFG